MTIQMGFQGANNGHSLMFSQSTHSQNLSWRKNVNYFPSPILFGLSWREGHVCLTKRPNLFVLFLKRSINQFE